MSNRSDREPLERWSEGESDQDPPGDMGTLFRAVPKRGPLSDAGLARVRKRLERGSSVRRVRGARELSLAVALVLGGTGAAFAEWVEPGWWQPARAWFAGATFDSIPPSPAPSPGQNVASGGAGTNAPRPLAEVPPAEVPALVQSAAPTVTTTTSPVQAPEIANAARSLPESASVDPRPPALPSALARESQAIEKVLTKLRREHDARGALVLLDQYAAEFPSGDLATEAAVARIDALLSVGDRARALSELRRLPLERVGRRSEFLVLRAELLAEQDCAGAVTDFDTALALSLGAPLAERALYGRAACRLRLGDTQGAKSDLATYLTRFPSGRFADEVRRRLAPR